MIMCYGGIRLRKKVVAAVGKLYAHKYTESGNIVAKL